VAPLAARANRSTHNHPRRLPGRPHGSWAESTHGWAVAFHQNGDWINVELFDTTMVGLERAMSGAQMRQQVLANNLANANTPGFKRSDVDFHSALAAAFGQGAATPAQIAQARFGVSTDSATSMRMDGNNVDVDTEMANLSENSLDFQSLTSVLTSRIKILQNAIGGTSA
jgi:flagellar basal-body rod protein FlgB